MLFMLFISMLRLAKTTPLSGRVHVRLRLTEIHALCFRALSARGLNERAARLVSDSMTTCEASGSHSHGLFRLQGYCEALSTSRVDGGAEPVLESPAGAAAVRVNARGAFAPAALAAAVPALTAAAKQHGVAACAIRDSHHFGALWPEASISGARAAVPHCVIIPDTNSCRQRRRAACCRPVQLLTARCGP